MSVLIKGMEMPEQCGLCDLFHAESPMHCTVVKGHKTVGAPYGMPRPDWCPLVDLGKHGRLIDADAIVNAMNDMKVEGEVFVTAVNYVKLIMNDADTIVEAEDSE